MVTLEEWDGHPLYGNAAPENADDWLFHYTSLERAASIALLGSMILSPLSKLNDPIESEHRRVLTFEQECISVCDEGEAEVNAFDQRVQALREQVRVVCFTRDCKVGEAGQVRRSSERGYARSRMWAQYADNHKGVCVAIDRAGIVGRAKEVFGDRLRCQPVVYHAGFDEATAEASMADYGVGADEHFENRILPGLFRKDSDWSAEREYRIVVDRLSADAPLLRVDDLVVGVLVGARFEPYLLPVLGALVERLGASDAVAQMNPAREGILAPYPMAGPDGEWRIWTDEDVLTEGRVFAPA